jgi:3,4-dihydroxy 2-butanone 4-phosphate synthase/GTP cyclohydrolase II
VTAPHAEGLRPNTINRIAVSPREFSGPWASPTEIIAEARNGRVFALVGGQGSRHFASLVVPAQMATPRAINFLAAHGRGLVCLALEQRRVSQLGLELQPNRNAHPCGERFTVSIEAIEGVSTGISAHDRARTVAMAIDANCGPDSLHSPGHVFPIVASEGGLLAHPGHTEGAVDVARLAGLNPSAVVCAMLARDGEIAGPAEVEALAAEHGFLIGAVGELVAYRALHDPLIRPSGSALLATNVPGAWRLHTFRDALNGVDAIALQSGDIAANRPVLAHLRTVSLRAHVPGAGESEIGNLRDVMHQIARCGGGIVVLQQPIGGTGGTAAPHAQGPETIRLSAAAQILLQLGATGVTLIDAEPGLCEAMTAFGIAARPADGATFAALDPPARASATAR